MPPFSKPHRRHNPLTDEWILVSSGRANRPWLGAREPAPPAGPLGYDPACYLCPGNRRAGGEPNPPYERTFAFTNDFAALDPTASCTTWQQGLLRADEQRGTCRVLCFSPRHDLPLARMSPAGVRSVIDLWAAQSAELGREYRWVQVFENRGGAMGASNPHPHGQIWATSAVPTEAAKEDQGQRRHWLETGRGLLLDYASQESGGPRRVMEDAAFLIVVPFWAAWPFEALILPKREVRRLPDLSDAERAELGHLLTRVLRGYDGLFDAPFPYTMGWHQAPFGTGDEEHWLVHGHVYPPLLRPAVRKFMVGYELLAETQRDLAPEHAAELLRNVVHT